MVYTSHMLCEAALTAAHVELGWVAILDLLTSLRETGEALPVLETDG